jgi:hypothetical protein
MKLLVVLHVKGRKENATDLTESLFKERGELDK